MTDIFIKSFNRPFYLDRCLSSIFQYVTGNFEVTVLDDGTPEKYLAKIQQKFPEVKILKSPNYSEKIMAIQENLETGKEINGFQIPTDFWIDAAENASEYFIITEDDVWFTEKINVDELVSDCKKLNVNLLKLGWLGNFSDDEFLNIKSLSHNMNSAVPEKLILGNEKFMNAFFHNKLKFFTLLYKLKIVDNKTQLKYWSLVSILMGLYKKEYWLETWKNMHGKVDEKRQLINASAYFKKHQHSNFIARLKNETMKTTFQSSATNSYHKYGNNFDVNLFNHQINEAWFRDKFNAMQNFPKDFTAEYFLRFTDEKIDRQEFLNWTEKFKTQYKNLGCDVH